jgi:hypothetical protein
VGPIVNLIDSTINETTDTPDVPTQNNQLVNDRVRMGQHGIPADGPCYVMSCFGIAQSFAGSNLTPEQIHRLFDRDDIWTGTMGGAGETIISAALEELGVDTSNLDIEVRRTGGTTADPNAFATLRFVGCETDSTRGGHWQEGRPTGGGSGILFWDPYWGTTDRGVPVFEIRNVFITERR